MARKAKTKKRRFGNLKKNIKNFVKDEDGFVAKENILKIGLSTVSALTIMNSVFYSASAATDAAGNCLGHTSHNENCTNMAHTNFPSNHDNALYRVPRGGGCWSLRHCNGNVQLQHSSGDTPCGGK
jgi:hypothetical protein